MSNSKDMPDLQAAYALRTPEDSKALYRTWADSYDETFANAMGYTAPAKIAGLFDERWNKTGRVLDVGCGTGLVGEALNAGPVDGLDISAEMLGVSAKKGIYGRLIEGDLTCVLDIEECTYAGLISAGTFTHGHVGPEALDELLRIAEPDALFVLGVNAEVFREQNFGEKLDELVRRGMIFAPEFVEGQIYAEDSDHTSAKDRFLAVVFHKRP